MNQPGEAEQVWCASFGSSNADLVQDSSRISAFLQRAAQLQLSCEHRGSRAAAAQT